jgi:2,4-dienoyl-CoA reductase-like NADH-dependent reductase (Old Yellow Enzyme family)
MIFKKLKIKKKTLLNRISVSSMCQYSANNGSPSKWHYNHLSSLISSGAGSLMMESTAVSKLGKITHKDLAIYTKKQANDLKKLLIYLKKLNGKMPIGIQISHSGRKGSANLPWVKKGKSLSKTNSPWTTSAPSSIRRSLGWPKPKEMKIKDIKILIKDFKKAASAANYAGFDILEIHMAHGYLLHEFMSPISNARKDKYGGSLNNRCRLLIEISQILRKVWPKNKILGARITGSDHLAEGIDVKDSIYLAKKLEKIGIDYICVSSGGILPKTKMKFKKGFRMKISKKIKNNTRLKICTTGMLNNLKLIEKGIINKSFDFVAIARPFLKNPRWIFEAANNTKHKKILPKQFLRSY